MSANLARSASADPSTSPSDSTTSSSSSSSDDDSSSTTSSSSAPASPVAGGSESTGSAPEPTRPRAGGTGDWRMTPNPTLEFQHPDMEYIPVPKAQVPAQVATMLQRMTGDKRLYPEGRYRSLDYFRVAVEMFIDAVRAEYAHQQKTAARNGRSLTRFTWRNDSELAVCFACCCDWMKLLYAKLAPSPFKPIQADFVSQMKSMLMSLSGVPREILPSKTYETKYLDWEKGGTRYHSGQSSANVRFPSAQDRRTKIETYLRSRAGLKIDPVKVDQAHPPQGSDKAGLAAPPTGVRVKTAPARPGAPPFVPPFSAAEGPGPVRASALAAGPRGPIMTKSTPAAAAARARHAPAQSAVKQMPEEMRHLYWLSSLSHIKGGDPGAAFPEERAAALPGLVRLCELTEQPSEMAVLLNVVVDSTEVVQQVFESLGGIVGFRRLFGRAVKQSVTDGHDFVIRFIERMVRFKVQQWSAASQTAWRTGMDGKPTDDLTWMRALPVIPVPKRAAWGALVLVMEEKFIFRLPREEAEAARKRSRLEAPATTVATPPSGSGSLSNMEAMRAAVSDNVSIQRWKLPRVYTLSALRMPAELRAPPFASDVEKESIDFLNRKRQFVEATQVEWEQRIRAMLRASSPAGASENTRIPIWYDPFMLLGVDPGD